LRLCRTPMVPTSFLGPYIGIPNAPRRTLPGDYACLLSQERARRAGVSSCASEGCADGGGHQRQRHRQSWGVGASSPVAWGALGWGLRLTARAGGLRSAWGLAAYAQGRAGSDGESCLGRVGIAWVVHTNNGRHAWSAVSTSTDSMDRYAYQCARVDSVNRRACQDEDLMASATDDGDCRNACGMKPFGGTNPEEGFEGTMGAGGSAASTDEGLHLLP
jgi:hypothetical protein